MNELRCESGKTRARIHIVYIDSENESGKKNSCSQFVALVVSFSIYMFIQIMKQVILPYNNNYYRFFWHFSLLATFLCPATEINGPNCEIRTAREKNGSGPKRSAVHIFIMIFIAKTCIFAYALLDSR